MKWASFLKFILSVLVAGLPLAIFWLVCTILFGSAGPADKDRYQAVAADILVPMFTGVLATLAATATVKALATVVNNARLLAHNKDPEPIKLFDW